MASEDEAAEKYHEEIVQLEPFIHQVGGRSSMLTLDASTICKPLILQELNFYQTLPEILKPFTPEFKGIIEVTCSEEKDGYLRLTTYSMKKREKYYKQWCDTDVNDKRLKWQEQHRKKHRIRLGQSGSLEIVSEESEVRVFTDANDDDLNASCPHNPWVLRCHQKQLNRTQASAAAVYTRKFLMLENLTCGYEYPCVLDLKMGTRQYADNASQVKRKSLEAKVAATTSGSLGLRICGMQVYHCDSSRFMCHNKFYGRKLNNEGFRNSLYQFFHNGILLRLDIILPLIERLEELYDIIKSMDTFRFFTSSLLIIYDGKYDEPMVENGNCDYLPKDSELAENGNSCTSETGDTKGNTEEVERIANLQLLDSHSNLQQTCGGASQIDVRMIDFAHSTHSKMADVKVTHSGPDDGYLFGLENLIAQLKSIVEEYSDGVL